VIGHYFQAAVKRYREMGEQWNRTEALSSLGRTALLAGEAAKAQQSFIQAPTLARQACLAARLVDSLTALAQIWLQGGDA
jgi:hypothetical protein